LPYFLQNLSFKVVVVTMRSRHCIFLRPEATDGVAFDIKVYSLPMPQHQFEVEGFKRLLLEYIPRWNSRKWVSGGQTVDKERSMESGALHFVLASDKHEIFSRRQEVTKKGNDNEYDLRETQ
jgi:hypothetical protein